MALGLGCGSNDGSGGAADANSSGGSDAGGPTADAGVDGGAPDSEPPDASVGDVGGNGGGTFEAAVVFSGTLEDEQRRLYAVDLDQPGVMRDISGDLGAGDVASFMLDPTGRYVAFGANAEDPAKVEVFGVGLQDLEAGRVRLSDDLPPGKDVLGAGKRQGTGAGFRFSPDGSHLYYLAEQQAGIRDLWRVPMSAPGSGASERVNDDLEASRRVGRFGFEDASGDRVIYLADANVEDEDELFRVETTRVGSGNAVRLSDDLVDRGDVSTWEPAGDGSGVVYRAAREFVGRYKLWAVRDPNVGSGNSFQLSDGDVASGGVFDFTSVPGSSLVVYSVAIAVRQFEIFRVDLDSPAVVTKLSGELVEDGSAGDGEFVVSPDGRWLVYRGDEEVDERSDLYAVDIADPTTRRRLSDPSAQVGDVIRVSPDGASVAYAVTDGATAQDERDRLMLVGIASGAPVELSHDLGAGSDIIDFEFTPDGASLVYQIRSGVDRARILFVVDIANPGVETLLHPPSRDDGRVFEFQMVP